MANRKQELDAAIVQSNQRVQEAANASAPVTPAAPKSRTAEFKLPYTKKQEAEAAAPVTSNRGVENILVKQEVKQAWQKRQQMTDAERAERIASAKKSTKSTVKRLTGNPVVEAKADEAAAKFLKRPKPKKEPKTPKKAGAAGMRINKNIMGSKVTPARKK